jgi:hypothetical protein
LTGVPAPYRIVLEDQTDMRSLQVLLVLAVALCAVGAYGAASNSKEVYIFRGGAIAEDGIVLGGWGSGKSVETKEKILTGSQSIKVTTQGLYSGGRIDFSQPVALFTEGIDKTRYVLFTLFFDAVQVVDPAAGTSAANDVDTYTIPKASKLRFVFISDKGQQIAIEEPTAPLDTDDNWVRIAVPLAKFSSAEGGKEFRLKRLLVFSDIATTMYIGEIKLVTDDTPIKVDSISDQTVAVQDDVFFVGNATAGISSLKYSWDYDASNGLQTESTGRVGHYTYTRAAKDSSGSDIPFKVTLTVSDVDGIKSPVTITTDVMVIE